MNKFLAIGLAALGLMAIAPQPAKADVGFSFSFGPAYYPDYYPGYYYYGRPYYYYGHRYYYDEPRYYYHSWRHHHRPCDDD
jgi:hypothetical protein